MKHLSCSISSILCFVICGVALAQSTHHAIGPNKMYNAWKQDGSDGLQYFWVDTTGDRAPNAYYAFLGLKYRQVHLDENSDGFSEFLALLNQDENYKYYQDLDADGLWEAVPPLDPGKIDDPFLKYRTLLVDGVTRRIELGDSPETWQPKSRTDLTYGFKNHGKPVFEKFYIRLTKTPSSLLTDPQREAKPLHLVDVPVKVDAGSESRWISGTIYAENDFFNEGRPTIKAKVQLNVFFLPIRLKNPEESTTESDLIQISGTIAIGDKKGMTFCALFDLSEGASGAVTIPMQDASGKENGSVFVEVIPASAMLN